MLKTIACLCPTYSLGRINGVFAIYLQVKIITEIDRYRCIDIIFQIKNSKFKPIIIAVFFIYKYRFMLSDFELFTNKTIGFYQHN